MFSALPPYAHTLSTYTPHVSSPLSSSPLRNSPSPLSPRDANLPSRDADEMMSSPTPASKTSRPSPLNLNLQSPSIFPSQSRDGAKGESAMRSSLPSPPPSRGRESVFSKRVTKANPLMNRNANEGREARRKLFLKKVREGSEEKRWRDRNGGIVEGEDEVLRAIWVAEERRREEGRRREAAIMGVVAEGEEEGVDFDREMVDEVAMVEERELEALIGSLSQDAEMPSQELVESLLWDRASTIEPQQQMDTQYGSDDEEYDDIFMDVIEEENRMASQQQLKQQPPPAYLDADHEMMDMN